MNYFRLNAVTAPMHSEEGMTHAVWQSIYNHSESTQNDRARMAEDERGGNWSDELLTIVGSRDWTLHRDKLTPQTLVMAKRFYEDALAWLITDGHAKAVAVSVWEAKPNQMGRDVIITLTDDTTFKVTL
ncbi:hypothetical protein EF707_10170 [Vibrio fluvialis]|nr:hypothetical protein [Vibrio fluvialis]